MPTLKGFPNLLPRIDPRYIKWRKSLIHRPPPWNKGKTKYTDNRVKKISETFKKKGIDNFSIWREKSLRIGPLSKAYIPFKKNGDLAFLIGLILGDGHLAKTSRTEVLRITLRTDKLLLWQYTVKIVNTVLRKKPQVKKRLNVACVDIVIYQNNLSNRLDIPAGAKKNYSLKLPKWIWDNDKFLKSSIKGLFEAEGSFSIHLKTYTYNLSFANKNLGLLDEVEKALIYFGYHPERRQNAVRLRKKHEALRFNKFIQFRRYPLI